MAKFIVRKVYYLKLGGTRLFLGEAKEVRDTETYARAARFLACGSLFRDCRRNLEVVRMVDAARDAPPHIIDKVLEVFDDDERIAMFRMGHLKFT